MRFEKELHLARSIAMHSGELAMGFQQRGVTAESKADLSPVTIADRECESLISKLITEVFPNDGLLGEEGASRPGTSGRTWIIDPIDGTRDFLRGNSLWAVLIGLEVDGEVVAGVSHLPVRREMYSAVKGEGAWLNENPIRISDIGAPSSAVLCMNGMNSMTAQPFAPQVLDWMRQFWAVRSLGGCVDAMMLASGQAEVYIEPKAAAWDLAPLKVILEEAGARFLNFDGGSSIHGGNCAACVPALEPALRDLLGLETRR
ncbi:MAG TPA: inositol monophosphatase family protein [Bryobacteraceae bacterium]|nr:inositol monophosphatase family protein [Bryobacteraceae bacterium]